MASVHDVAAYILDRRTPLSTMKLQKLVYYSQAWSLVWDNEPLFEEPIEAWANGPVVRELYEQHRGQFAVDSWPLGNPSSLSVSEASTVDAVLKYYGDKSARWLSDLSHAEDPWKHARKGLPDGSPSDAVIHPEMMRQYYSSL